MDVASHGSRPPTLPQLTHTHPAPHLLLFMKPRAACMRVSSPPLSRNTTGPGGTELRSCTSVRASSSATPTQEAQSDAPARTQGREGRAGWPAAGCARGRVASTARAQRGHARWVRPRVRLSWITASLDPQPKHGAQKQPAPSPRGRWCCRAHRLHAAYPCTRRGTRTADAAYAACAACCTVTYPWRLR